MDDKRQRLRKSFSNISSVATSHETWYEDVLRANLLRETFVKGKADSRLETHFERNNFLVSMHAALIIPQSRRAPRLGNLT